MEEYIYQGRIAICAPREKGNFNQHGISAILIADPNQPLITDSLDWENIQCEIIIRPLKRVGKSKIKNLRLDQVAQALGDDSQWQKEGEENTNKLAMDSLFEKLKDSSGRPKKGICVDGGTEGNPGPCFYRGVDLETGDVVFEEHVGLGTNNIAEFLGVCHAVRYCEKNGLEPIIWSDSQTAIAWFKHKAHKSTFKGESAKLLEVSINYIKNKDIVINKWLTNEWGEIPADFGRK